MKFIGYYNRGVGNQGCGMPLIEVGQKPTRWATDYSIVKEWAINIIKTAYPKKSTGWASRQWQRAMDNIDVPVTPAIAVELLRLAFGIICITCRQGNR